MRIETYGQQLDVTPALRDYVESKLARLERHFDHQTIDVRVSLRVDKPLHCAEATLNFAGASAMHADASGPDMYAAIDLLADKLDRLVLKHKGKLVDQSRRNADPARSGDFA
ncbi:MAG TPA: ribosome-associated translation inhibitor RaiA [Xanthomonadaceae bacterium]|jgi:putative sigma-54 modulation protein|nr:ribosome-associated translation inhibitor RaiA [Xanthomonadaceae bacterium]